MKKMTHVALVSLDGDIDASLAPSYEDALALLRQRAEFWDWEIDPEHPLDRATATLEELSALYAHDGDERTCWVNITDVIVPSQGDMRWRNSLYRLRLRLWNLLASTGLVKHHWGY